MLSCPNCDESYVITSDKPWDGTCKSCKNFIGHEFFRFAYYIKNQTVSSLHIVYLPNEVVADFNIDVNMVNPYIYPDLIYYISGNKKLITNFYEGWVTCRNHLMNFTCFRDKFISYEGIIQEN